MNLPTTKPVVENVFLDIIEPEKLLIDLNTKQFTGYIYLVIHSLHSFEENIIFFQKGNVAGAIYLNNLYNAEMLGKSAFDLSLNSLCYNDGLLNIYSLSEEQLKLVLIFNDKIKYDYNLNPKTISKLKLTFNDKLVDNLLKDKIVSIVSRQDLFNRFNINELLRL